MKAYYNENDKRAVAWLKVLVSNNQLATGVVDPRDVQKVTHNDIKDFTHHHFFAGIGGWELARQWADWQSPLWTASLPCQPFSTAGKKLGTADKRHIWPYFHNLINQSKPPIIVGEQVASKPGTQWLSSVRADLETLGYAFGATNIPAASVGAPHIRQRFYWCAVRLGNSQCYGLNPSQSGKVGGSKAPRSRFWMFERQGSNSPVNRFTNDLWWKSDWLEGSDKKWRPIEPGHKPLDYGLPQRVGLFRGYGNAIVPQLGTEFLKALKDILIWKP